MKSPIEKALSGKAKSRAMKSVKDMESMRAKGSKTMDIIRKHAN